MSKAHKLLTEKIKDENYARHWIKSFYELAKEKDRCAKMYKDAISGIVEWYPDDKAPEHYFLIPPPSETTTFDENRFLKLLTTIDFEGLYFPIAEEDLSPTYSAALHADSQSSPNLHSDNFYNLNNVPQWKIMKNFSSIRSMRKIICDRLSELKILPEKLHELNHNDVLHIIRQHNITHPDKAMPCRRTKFLKMFAACYGKDFVRIESYFGHKKEALDFLAYTTYLGTSKKIPPEIRLSAERYNVHHRKWRTGAKCNTNGKLTLCNKELHSMIHYLKKNINPRIVYFGTITPFFHIMRDFEKEHLYACGKISDYQIPDTQYISSDTKRHQKTNKNKKNKDHKEATQRVHRNHHCTRRGRR